MQAQENTQTGYNILIVDSDAEFADLVAQTIGDADSAYSVTVTPDTQEALAYVQRAHADQRPVDLVIADVKTIGTSSVWMVEELSQSFPDLKIVTMTAYHSPELAAHIDQLDVYTHLVKPVAPSEFRRLVHNALAGIDAGTESQAAPPPLDNAQRDAIERQLANLRRATGSTAALLVHTGGAIRAMDRMDSELEAGTLCQALMDAQRAISQALAQTMHTQSPIQQSLFSTDSYSICVHRLDDRHAVAIIFDATVKEGPVRYALREGIEALQQALATASPDTPSQRPGSGNKGKDMVDRYFDDLGGPRARSRRSTRERTAAPPVRLNARAAVESPSPQAPPTPRDRESVPEQPRAVADPDPAQPPPPPPLEMEPIDLDEIDWDLGDSPDWETLDAEADQSFLGLSFQEARERGLLDASDKEQPER